MKKTLITLLVLSSNAFASETLENDFAVSYKCGSSSGYGLMGVKPEYEGAEKIFEPNSTAVIGDITLTNPTYDFQHSSSACTVAGAGELEAFVWYVNYGECIKVETHSLTKDELNICGVSIKLSKG